MHRTLHSREDFAQARLAKAAITCCARARPSSWTPVLPPDRPIAGAVRHHAVGRISRRGLVIAHALSVGDIVRLQDLGTTVCSTIAPTV